ncbi:MAG: LysR family transcriptional regulator, partial [Oscillospiraceae bacterium]
MLLKELRYVLAITTYGSVAKAAEHLYLSQPALSKYIQNLENNLSTALFHRINGRLSLTYAGERYVSAATRMLDIFEQMESEVQDIEDAKRGRIRVGISTFRGPFLLPTVISAFHRDFPNIEIVIQEQDADALEHMLLHGELDLCVVNLPLTRPGLAYIPLLEEELLLTVPKDYPNIPRSITLPGKKYPWIDLASFAKGSFILLKKELKTRGIVNALLREAGFAPQSLIETSNIDTAFRLSAAGFGVSIVPETFALNSASLEKPLLFSIGVPDT